MAKHDTPMPQFYTLSTPKYTGVGFTKWTSSVKMAISTFETLPNHWLPRGQTHPEVVQGTAEFHHEITDSLLPETGSGLARCGSA